MSFTLISRRSRKNMGEKKNRPFTLITTSRATELIKNYPQLIDGPTTRTE